MPAKKRTRSEGAGDAGEGACRKRRKVGIRRAGEGLALGEGVGAGQARVLRSKVSLAKDELDDNVAAYAVVVAHEESIELKDVFPFMDLPAELRLNIYRMALRREGPLVLHVPRPIAQEGAGGDEVGYGSDGEEGVSQGFIHGERRDAGDRAVGSGDAEGDGQQKESAYKYDLNPALLRVSRQIYKEAKEVLYSENNFLLQIDSGIHTLKTLHQRTRSLIKHVSLSVPSHHDILDGFADLVRLGLRYCWGLKSFTIMLPDVFPDDRFMAGTTSVYANAFHILRWLPKGCKVQLEGSVHRQIRQVVEDEGRLQRNLDATSYLRRQHQMPERH